jgi:hypothetical protein
LLTASPGAEGRTWEAFPLSAPDNTSTRIRTATRSEGNRPAGPNRRSRLRRNAMLATYSPRCDQGKARSIHESASGTIKASGGGPLAPDKNSLAPPLAQSSALAEGPKAHRTSGRRHRASPRDMGAGRDGSMPSTNREAASNDWTRPRPDLLTMPSPRGATSITATVVSWRDRRRWTEADELARLCGCRCYRCQRPPAPGLPPLPAGPEVCPEGCWGCAA